MTRPALLLALALAAAPAAAQADSLAWAAQVAYLDGSHAEAARLFTAAHAADPLDPALPFYAAGAAALAGDADAAFDLLGRSARLGFLRAEQVAADPDLTALHADPRWPAALGRFRDRAADAARLWRSPALRAPFRDTLSVDERIGGLATLWAEARAGFAAFDRVPSLDWDSVFVAALPRVRAAASTLDYYRELAAVAAHLGDGHTSVWVPPALFDRAYAVPAFDIRLVEGRLLVAAVLDSALAVAVGDEIVAVDGVPVADHVDTHVRPLHGGPLSDSLDVVAYGLSLLAGDLAVPVRLTLRDAAGATRDVAVPRRPYLDALARLQAPPFALDWLPGDVAHIRLGTFGGAEAADRFVAHLPELARAAGLVLDLRDNWGGDGAVGYRVLCALTGAGRIPTSAWEARLHRPLERARGHGDALVGEEAPTFGCGDGPGYDGPVALLVGPRTGSAAEDAAVAFDLMGRGPIVGERTAGSTGQPLLFALPGGGTGRVLVKRDRYPDGREILGVGVQPDVVARPTVADLRAGRDAALDAARAAVLSDDAGPVETALAGGRLRMVHVYRAQARALAGADRPPTEATLDRLMRDVFAPHTDLWTGYLGDESRFRAWARDGLLGPDSPFAARVDTFRTLGLAELFEGGAAWVEAATGRAPEGTWYLVYGPGWTDMGGIGGAGMVADLSKLSSDREGLRHTVVHELVHQVHGPSKDRLGDPDRGTVLDRIVSEGLGTYAAHVYAAGARAPAQAVGYSEDEWRWALAHEAELAEAAAALLDSRDRADVDRVASRSQSILDPGVGAPGYFLGFRIVEAYEARHGAGSWAEMLGLPVREALRRSGYPHLVP